MRPRHRQHASGRLLVGALPALVLLGSLGLGVLAVQRADKEAPKPARVPVFEEDVLPILKAKCLRCHGDKARKADLDLSTAAGALKGGESGPAVVAGKPQKSPLYEKVHAGEMPPDEKGRLT